MGVAVAADQRRWSADARIGSGVRPGIRWPVSCVHPKSREIATCVPGPGRCESPDGRWRSNSEPGCGARSRGARGSPADRIRGEEKIFCCVTTRGRNFGVLNSLGRCFGAVAALLLSLGMLVLDASVLTTFRLAARRLPAADLPPAFRVLAVSLVKASRLVLASTPFVQTAPRAGAALSGFGTVRSFNVVVAHGRLNLPRESPGRMFPHSPRALSKREQDDCLPV